LYYIVKNAGKFTFKIKLDLSSLARRTKRARPTVNALRGFDNLNRNVNTRRIELLDRLLIYI